MEHRPWIEQHLTERDVHERRVMLEQFLDEQDDLTSAVAEKKREIKDTNVNIERVTARVRQLRQEIRTRIVMVPAPEPQQNLGFADTERERPQPTNGHGAIDANTDHPAPEIEPWLDVFAQRYPMARDVPTLRLVVEELLTPEQREKLDGWAIPHPGSATFDAVAHWARIETAHLEAPKRAPVAGLCIPKRLPMPEALATLIGDKPKPKRGARPLSSPRKRKDPK